MCTYSTTTSQSVAVAPVRPEHHFRPLADLPFLTSSSTWDPSLDLLLDDTVSSEGDSDTDTCSEASFGTDTWSEVREDRFANDMQMDRQWYSWTSVPTEPSYLDLVCAEHWPHVVYDLCKDTWHTPASNV